MDESGLMYQDETGYAEACYLKILMNICGKKDVSFEADSEADFLKGVCSEYDRAPFLTWDETGNPAKPLDDAYFADLAEEAAGQGQGDRLLRREAAPGVPGLERLEKWLAVKSCKINDSDQYIIAPCHPMAKLIDCENQDIRDRFGFLPAEQNDMMRRIKRAVLQDYLRLNENFYLYGTGQVYYSVRREGCRRAIPWREVGTLTSISSIRLIEKVGSWIKRNCNTTGEENPKVRIAYIGTVTDKEFLSEYFRENPILLNGRRITPQVELVQLKRVRRGEQYAFERTEPAEGSKRFYNFSSLTDAKELFRNFEIVLFLDESYFYKQGQTPKNLKEKSAASYVSWCLKEMRRELELISDEKMGKEEAEREKERIKCFFYGQIYNRAGLWLNGCEKRFTSKLGFDRELFQTIAQAICPEHDVYLYISRGKTIGNIDLSLQSLCNDERYDGKKLLVYKVTEQKEVADGSDVGELMREMLKDNDHQVIVSLDLWKLVKSIGRDFLEEVFCRGTDGNARMISQIALLRNSFLNVSIQKEGDRPRVHFDLESPAASEEQENLLTEFVQGFLSLCKEEKEFPYVRNFLYNLLISAFVARAESARGLFYAYLMKEGRFVDIDTNVTKTLKRPGREGHQSLFWIRRSIYSAIQGLDNIMVRDMERRLDLLKYEMRYKYCPDINERELMLLLEKIHQYCEEAGCTQSNLYLLTKGELK